MPQLIKVIIRQQGDCGFDTLTSVGLDVDVIGNAAEHDSDFDAGFLNSIQQSRGEQATPNEAPVVVRVLSSVT